jgi:hypothetical protein
MGNTAVMPDLPVNTRQPITLTPDGTPDPNVPPPAPSTADLPAIGVDRRTGMPSVVGYPGGGAHSRFDLTRRAEAAPAAPDVSINPYGPGPVSPTGSTPGYLQASTDPLTGQPTAMNPSLTKLGKLLTVLRAAGTGGIVGSTQPTFGTGFEAAQQNTNQQINQNLQQQQARMGIEQARANIGMVNTPWGPMPMGLYRSILPKVLPAQIAGESRENVADTRADASRDVAGTNADSRMAVARFNAASKEKAAALAGPNSTLVDAKFAQDHNIPPEFIGTRIKVTDMAALNRSTLFDNVPVQTGDGEVIVNRRTGIATKVKDQNGNPTTPVAWATPKEVADPDNPGQTKFMTTGQAMAQGAQGTQSAAVQVPRQAMKAEMPTKIGDQKVAFTTMVQHADLLRRAAKALNNGDIQTLSGLENAFKNEFGYAGPITASAIADAYKGEVANVINKGHITDTGSEKIAHTLDPTKQNYETIDSVLGAYQGLAQSKMNMLNQQEQAAIDRAQAKKGKTGSTPPAAGGGKVPPHPFFQKYGGVADRPH